MSNSRCGRCEIRLSAHGARSTAAISVLMRRGYHNLLFVKGGFSAWQKAGFEAERGG